MSILKDFRDVFYPRNLTCSVCKRENFSERSICEACQSILPYNNKSICGHCGRATAFAVEYCDYCKNRQTFIDQARSVFVYESAISQLIRRFKYDGDKYLSEFFAEELKPVFLKYIGYADVIVYVPSTKKKVRQRGYNQCEALAREFSTFAQIPVVDSLEKVKETDSQVGLTKTERMQNLKGSIKVVNKKVVKGKRVLLIDDVMTTGSTVETVAEKLKNAGAREVVVLTIASVNFKKSPQENVEGHEKPDVF